MHISVSIFCQHANMGRKRFDSRAKDLWLIPVTTPVFQFEHWFNPYGQEKMLFMGPANVVFKFFNLSFSQKDWNRKEELAVPVLRKNIRSLSKRDSWMHVLLDIIPGYGNTEFLELWMLSVLTAMQAQSSESGKSQRAPVVDRATLPLLIHPPFMSSELGQH